MGTHCSFNIILGLLFSLEYISQLAATGIEYLPPPTDFTVRMNGPFSPLVVWKFPMVNCTLRYYRNLTMLGNDTTLDNGILPRVSLNFEVFDLNRAISVDVKAECIQNPKRKSKWETYVAQLAPGNERTSVRNFVCLWYYLEYVNCTWQPGPETPPSAQFVMLYWAQPHDTESNKNIDTTFKDFLETGQHCQSYFSSGGMNHGCHFKFQERTNDSNKLLIVVTDQLRSIKPFIFYAKANYLAKLKPPTITNAYRTTNRSILVQWDVSRKDEFLAFELQVKMSSTDKEEPVMVKESLYTEIYNALPEITYTFKIRVRLDPIGDDEKTIWSDWSETKTVPGEDDGKTSSTILLIIIPIIVVVAAVILLIYRKRLTILICPSIPDPGKMFANDLQEWLRSERPSVHNKPELVVVSPVSLLETSLTSSQMD